MSLQSFLKKIALFLGVVVALYGAGRLYFALTDGFSVSNISSEIPYDPQWETHVLSNLEQNQIDAALSQNYSYLGKGCQSYVFISEDRKYVIKFLKYKHFKAPGWLEYFTFIPPVEKYQMKKSAEKTRNLHKIFQSWKIAYENLSDKSGLLYIHLNKTPEWKKTLHIKDKMGISHTIALGDMEFLVQRTADMLESKLETLMAEGKQVEAEQVIDRLIQMLLDEYRQAYADNDHALMQNTGVLNGQPIHIDVGQFIHNKIVMDPKIYKQELFDKTYDFHTWLQKHYPDLAAHLRARLISVIGLEYYLKKPYKHKGNVGKIPHIKTNS